MKWVCFAIPLKATELLALCLFSIFPFYPSLCQQNNAWQNSMKKVMHFIRKLLSCRKIHRHRDSLQRKPKPKTKNKPKRVSMSYYNNVKNSQKMPKHQEQKSRDDYLFGVIRSAQGQKRKLTKMLQLPWEPKTTCQASRANSKRHLK